VGDGATTDYMPVVPVSSEVFGIASTHLSIAAAGAEHVFLFSEPFSY